MCVSAETGDYHTEMDCAYTFIRVPNQKRDTVIYQLLSILASIWYLE